MDLGDVDQHMYMGHVAPNEQLGQEAAGTGKAGEKSRSKVSRACDDCRRKKVRFQSTDVFVISVYGQLIVVTVKVRRR